MSPPQSYQKAKSRRMQGEPTAPVLQIAEPLHNPDTVPRHRIGQLQQLHTFSFWEDRVRYVLLLILGIIGYGGCIYILRFVHPEQIANILFYHSYLPLLLVSYAAHFFFWSFILLSTRRAALLATILTILLFCKLQAVLLTLPLILAVVAIALLIELATFFILRK